MEVLLVRFKKEQRKFIRKWAKKLKKSEAQVVRDSVDFMSQDVQPLSKQ